MSGVKDRIKMFESFSPETSTTSPTVSQNRSRPSSASSAMKRKPFGKPIGDAWTGAAKTNSDNPYIDSPSEHGKIRKPDFGYKISKRPSSADRSKYEGKLSPKFRAMASGGLATPKQALLEGSEKQKVEVHDGEKENVVSVVVESPINTGRSVGSTGSVGKAYKSVEPSTY